MAWTTKSSLSQTLPSSAKAASMEAWSETSQSISAAGLQRLDQRQHALLEHIALIGKGQFRAGLVQRLGDAPGNGVLIGDAHDQAAFALHQAFKRHAETPRICRSTLVI